MKKYAVILLALLVSAMSLAGSGDINTETQSQSAVETVSQSTISSQEVSSAVSDDTEYFSNSDLRSVESEEANAAITLSGREGTISDTTRGTSGSEVEIRSKGIYKITGESEDVTIVVNDDNKSGTIYLLLDNVTMTNSEEPCIYVEACDKVVIQCVGTNTLTYTAEENGDGLDGAVYSNDDLTVNGSGELEVTSTLHGIVCKDDLKFTGGTVSVTADKIGVKAGNSVCLTSAVLDIDSYHDGIQVENSGGDSFYYSEDSTVTVNADYDGINVGASGDSFTGFVKIVSGDTNIVSGGGSDNSKSDTSQKGIKCKGDIIIGDADNDELTLNVSGADDAVNSKGSVYVNGGTLTLSSSDDGISAYSLLEINGGVVDVTKSYEGLEAGDITINGGDISIAASDDGVNTAGGSDTENADDDEFVKTENGALTINNGTIYVNASGDGLDSNGSIYVNGGTVIIEGPADNGNAALDKGDSADCVLSISGGTVLALGSTAKANNFDSGEQCSALITVSGSEGTTIKMSDGFEFTATKKFDCIVYSSPNLEQGKSYTANVGDSTVEFSFENGLYFAN